MSRRSWQRLARVVVSRRTELGLTQEELAAAGGPSTATVRLIESARQTSYRALTLAALDRALLWQPGSTAAVLEGAAPSPIPLPEPSADTTTPADRFESLYQKHYDRLVRHVTRFAPEDADDVAHEVMIRLWLGLQRGGLDPSNDPWPWMSVTARNVAIDRARALARPTPYDRLVSADPADQVMAAETADVVRAALQALPERDRRVLTAHHLEGRPTADIAVELGVTDNAVRQMLFRARKRLADEVRRTGLTS